MIEKTISVLMPVYNAERYVKDAVESILAQSYTNFECILLDDGSTDSSLDIMRGLATKDSRIRLLSRANTGLVVALNELMGLACGSFLARMDADDLAHPDRFKLQLRAFREDPALVAVGSTVEIVDPDGEPLLVCPNPYHHDDIDAWHLAVGAGAAMCHPSVLMRAEAVRRVGGYRKEFWPAEDADLFLRLAEVGKLANLPEVLLKYRFHLKSIGHQNARRQRDALYRSAADAASRRGLPRPRTPLNGGLLEKEAVVDVSSHHCLWAWWALRSGHIRVARKHAFRSVTRGPLSADSWRVMYCALRGR